MPNSSPTPILLSGYSECDQISPSSPESPSGIHLPFGQCSFLSWHCATCCQAWFHSPRQRCSVSGPTRHSRSTWPLSFERYAPYPLPASRAGRQGSAGLLTPQREQPTPSPVSTRSSAAGEPWLSIPCRCVPLCAVPRSDRATYAVMAYSSQKPSSSCSKAFVLSHRRGDPVGQPGLRKTHKPAILCKRNLRTAHVVSMTEVHCLVRQAHCFGIFLLFERDSCSFRHRPLFTVRWSLLGKDHRVARLRRCRCPKKRSSSAKQQRPRVQQRRLRKLTMPSGKSSSAHSFPAVMIDQSSLQFSS